MKAGLPNITGNIDWVVSWTGGAGGAFYLGDSNNSNSGSGNNVARDYKFDASRSNSIYGNSDTVQPQTTKFYYYIVVGTVLRTDIEININNVLSDLENKINKNGSNLSDSDILSLISRLMTNEIGYGATVQQKIQTSSYTGGFKIGSLIINWGAGNNQTITYKIPFSAANTYRVTTAATSFTSIANNPVAGNYTSTGCTLKFGNGGTQGEIAYIAIGF